MQILRVKETYKAFGQTRQIFNRLNIIVKDNWIEFNCFLDFITVISAINLWVGLLGTTFSRVFPWPSISNLCFDHHYDRHLPSSQFYVLDSWLCPSVKWKFP